MKMADKEPNKTKKQLNKIASSHYSKRELEDLMGIHMQTLKRVNGAWRRK